MTSYWPSGINFEDNGSPLDILTIAKDEWEGESDGRLTMILEQTESTNGNTFIDVHAKYVPTNQTINLFSVVHRPDSPYPARIQLRDEELPDFLKKTYTRKTGVAGLARLAANFAEPETEEITNKWVCDTPSEFSEMLKRALNIGVLKAEIVSLISKKSSEVVGIEESSSKSKTQKRKKVTSKKRASKKR